MLLLQVDAYAELPYFMNPLLAACQLVNVSQPGSEPPLAQAQEDMRLFSPALADKQGEHGASREQYWELEPQSHQLQFLARSNKAIYKHQEGTGSESTLLRFDC